ncbi:hypothetical protein H3146_16605 [Streptomyces sp. OF3]|uniref:Uncharacterized protein n=1 Tax=Streptomyces alkaliterrae TaxID=2213162 RepID=A0A7W3WMA1_9ACTN|nr:hypothetical protein [Streptomyces alkaliterrae]MBB1254961.1 hypothetical protein [Streptomyces alkaliterrae]
MSSSPIPTGLLGQSLAEAGVPGALTAVLVLLLGSLLHVAMRVLLRRQARRIVGRLLRRVPSTGDPARDARLRRAVVRTHLAALEGHRQAVRPPLPGRAQAPRAVLAVCATLATVLTQVWGPVGLLCGVAAVVVVLVLHAAAPWVEGVFALRGTIRELVRLPRTGDPAVDAARMHEVVSADSATLRVLAAEE